jgi:tRNA(Ile)-lysidine synthase
MNPMINLNLVSPGDAIVVAVSGGIDSMVLLDALCAIRTDMNLSLSVAHVNHGVRKESEEEYEFV